MPVAFATVLPEWETQDEVSPIDQSSSEISSREYPILVNDTPLELTRQKYVDYGILLPISQYGCFDSGTLEVLLCL